MEHTFKVGDRVTCSCWEILHGEVFTISEIVGKDTNTVVKLPGASCEPGQSEWYNVNFIKLVEPVKVCKHCGQRVVEVERFHKEPYKVLFHKVNGKLFRMCKYAVKEAGSTTDYFASIFASTGKQPIRKRSSLWGHVPGGLRCDVTFYATPEDVTPVVAVPVPNLTVSNTGRRKFRDD